MAKKETALATQSDDNSAMVTKGSIADVMRNRNLSLSRQVTLKEGDLLCGTFLGSGGSVELDSKTKPGAKDIVAIWRIKADDHNVIFNVLGSAGLDKHVQGLAPGTYVAIKHLGTQKTTKGFNVNDFAVAVELPQVGAQ